MIDLASIRNASFTLTPTGYNPEEVDQFLADLADQLAELPTATPAPAAVVTEERAAIEPEVEMTTFAIEQPVVLEPVADERPTADLNGLQRAVERTIGAMDAFVAGELAAVKEASTLELDEIHRERERLLEEAGETARAHLDDTRVRAERIMEEARNDGDEMRRRFEGELQAERERFEQALADREAQAQARVAGVMAEAEERKREADELVASATRAQSQVLASIEQARVSLATTSDDAPVADGGEEYVTAEDDRPAFGGEPSRGVSLHAILSESRGTEAVEFEHQADEPADESDATDAAA
jgi:DivIVA domain-containing protein